MRSSSLAVASFFAALGFVRPASADLVEAGCKACLEQKGEAGAPLVVALHGDNAPAYHRKFAAALAGSALRAKVTLFAPRCPVELGCKTGSWWQWLATTDHDEGWLGARIDEAIARTGADPKRVVAVGYSGGATYLGYYGPSHPERFEAIAHVSGGAPLGARCPSLKYPVLFYLGAGDPMIAPYTEPLRKFYDGCGGHEVVWKTERGVTHEGMLDRLKAGGADEVIGWLLARARSRHPDPQPSPSPSLSLSLSPSPSPSPNPSPQPSPNPNPIPSPSSVPPPRPSRVAPRAGCGCELAGSATGDGGGVLVVLAIAAGLSRLGGRATSSLRLSRTRRVRR